jgi:hypothetical protein
VVASISNAHYPREQRNLTSTLIRWGTQAMWDTLANELKEFWPRDWRPVSEKARSVDSRQGFNTVSIGPRAGRHDHRGLQCPRSGHCVSPCLVPYPQFPIMLR